MQFTILYTDIKGISKNKLLGIFDSGIEIAKDDGEFVNFCRF